MTEVDEDDAVAFAEAIHESWKQVSPEGGVQSIPAQRQANLARAFLKLKFPFQCCGRKSPEPECEDCPMKPWHSKLEEAKFAPAA